MAPIIGAEGTVGGLMKIWLELEDEQPFEFRVSTKV
jgi:hypothetical protein